MPAKLLLSAMLAVSLASAQRGGGAGGGRGGRGGGGGEGMSMPRAARQTKSEQLRDKLSLNKDQQEEAQKILIAASRDAGPIRGLIDNARVQIAGVLIEGKGDEELKKATAAYAAAAAQMTTLEAKAFAEIYATLKPKQQSKAEQAFEVMAGIFSASGGGQGNGGQGRQGRSR